MTDSSVSVRQTQSVIAKDDSQRNQARSAIVTVQKQTFE